MSQTPDPVDVDSDELYLDSDKSTDNEYWKQLAKNFAIKPSDSKLPKLGLSELRDQAEFRGGYHMFKPKEMKSWEQLQASFAIPSLWQKDKAFNDKSYEASPLDDVSEAPSKKPRHDEKSRKAPFLAAVSFQYERYNGCGHPGL